MKRALIAALGLSLVTLAPSPAHADWSTPKFLSSKGHTLMVESRTQVVLANNAGDVVAAYLLEDNSLVVRRMPRGTTQWTAPQKFPGPAGPYAEQLTGAIDEQGRSCLAWNAVTEAYETYVLAVCYSPESGWGAVKKVSGYGDLSPATVVMNKGVATFLWVEEGVLKFRRWDGAWRRTIDPALDADEVVAGIEASGRVTVAIGEAGGVRVTTISRKGAVASPADVCNIDCANVKLAVTNEGAALVFWARFSDNEYILEALHRSTQGTWGATEEVATLDGATPAGISALFLTGNRVNDTFVVGWSHRTGTTVGLYSRHRFGNGDWSDVATIDEFAADFVDGVAMQLDADRVVFIVWRRDGGDPVRGARVHPDGATEQSGFVSDPLRATTDEQDLTLALRGKRSVFGLLQDRAPASVKLRVSWFKWAA